MIEFSNAAHHGRKAARREVGRKESPKRLAMENASKCPVSGKRKYATEGAALATAKHQIATADAPMELHAYRCNWCHAWHLTKKVEKEGSDRK
jgi:hypothetical protein